MSKLRSRSVLLVVGPGGVGKTTSCAALALAFAAQGKRVLVVTIDPSRRLAQALGLDEDDSARAGKIVRVSLPDPADGPVDDGPRPTSASEHPHATGSLDALLLDTGEVFDEIVRACARDAEAAQSLLENRIYRATTQRLGGALEYAAMARLQILHQQGSYDLIILDTPPTANAVDFLSAPRRIKELIDNPASKLLLSTGRIGGSLLGFGSRLVMRSLSAMSGGAVLDELGTFLRDFSEVVAEFQRRGGDFERLLRSEQTGVVLATATEDFTMRESEAFLAALEDDGFFVDACVINRVDRALRAPPSLADLRELAARVSVNPPSTTATPSTDDARAIDETARRWLRHYERARAAGEHALEVIAQMQQRHPALVVRAIPRQEPVPESLAQLGALGRDLLAS